jgi:hypothetical protein
MKLNRKHIRKLILREMAEMSGSEQNFNMTDVFSIRLLSMSPGYFLNGRQITGEKEEGISMLIEDQMTGDVDHVLLARIAQGMGAEFILDQGFQEMYGLDTELYRPIPIEEYIKIRQGTKGVDVKPAGDNPSGDDLYGPDPALDYFPDQ